MGAAELIRHLQDASLRKSGPLANFDPVCNLLADQLQARARAHQLRAHLDAAWLAACEERLKAAQEIRDTTLESCATPEGYTTWLQTFFKPCCEVLRSVPAQLEDSAEHRLRNTVLEILTRLQPTEVFKPHVQELFDVGMVVVQSDNQDNAVLAVKMMFDLQRAYKGQMEAQAAQFLELALQVGGWGSCWWNWVLVILVLGSFVAWPDTWSPAC